MKQESLVTMGRGHNLQEFYDSFEMFKSVRDGKCHNLRSINCDMILGLPHETLADSTQTVE